MAALTVTSVLDTGITPSLTAASSSDTVADDGTNRTWIEVVNGGGGSINVTVPAQQTSVVVPGVGSLAVADIVVAVANGTRRFIGPWTRAYINSAGNVTVNFSGTTSVTVGAFKTAKED
jgi:hypothetical protein